MPRRRDVAPSTCSFCGKTEDDGVRLIAGPSVWICHECAKLCWEIVSEVDAVRPSVIQECTVVLEDGSRHLVVGGLRETALQLGRDDSSIVAFDLVEGGRLAVRRSTVRHLLADPEPTPPPLERPDWIDQVE